MIIKEFQGEFRWLSNFEPVPITKWGLVFPSVEHAYMAAKSVDPEWHKKCALDGFTPGQIKRMSRFIELRPDWASIKIQVMREAIDQKFDQEPFRTRLLETGDALIQEGNNWGDCFWGVDLKTGKGENHLGKLIMYKRTQLRRSKP